MTFFCRKKHFCKQISVRNYHKAIQKLTLDIFFLVNSIVLLRKMSKMSPAHITIKQR